MKLFDLAKVHSVEAGVMAFGFFDSIHIGHKKVIGDAVAMAKSMGTVSSVFLFRNNIYSLIGLPKEPIFDFEERVSFIEDLGADSVFYIDADKVFLSMSPYEFIAYLKDRVMIRGFTCGRDFTFGSKGIGTPDDLMTAFGRGAVSDLLLCDGEKVGTDRIKQALANGDISLAERFLGRTFSLRREVLRGRSDGRKMGFPTLNVALSSVPLKSGVYFTNVYINDHKYKAVTNVGDHPTFADPIRNIESHLLDYDGDLYGYKVIIEFLHYRRSIEKFGSASELARRIEQDVTARRAYD